MNYSRRISSLWRLLALASVSLVATVAFSYSVSAINTLPEPDPKPGSFGIEATKTQMPPTQAPRITTPGNGASFGNSPISVNGICHNDLLVEVYNNDVMVGSTMCRSGSFSLEISLFAGKNDLSAIQYDDLGQPSPRSSVVSITYTDTRFSAFGELVTLTSAYGRRSAPAGNGLVWPLQLSGGTGPYALSIDWGDGTEPQLQSQALASTFNINHTYKQAGIYTVNVRVTDTNGVSAFLQLVAVSSGEVNNTTATTDENTPVISPIKVLWIPAAIVVVLLIPAYWLGRKSQLTTLRRKMLKERDSYQDETPKSSIDP